MTGPRHSLRVPMSPHERPVIDGLHREEDQLPVSRWWMALVALLGVAAVVAGALLTSQTAQVEDQAEQLPIVAEQRDAAVEEVRDLGRDVLQACAAGDVVQSPDGRDLCARASAVQADPVPGEAIQGERGPGPTLEQIEAAVAAYCAARNSCVGRSATPQEVAAAVDEWLTANPPRDGRTPTAAELAELVALYFAANPPPRGEDGRDGADGRPGKDGERGPGPTPEEIQAAVDAHLAENPPPPGPACPPGSSLQAVTFASGETGLGCVTGAAPTTSPPTTEPTVEPTADSDLSSETGSG